MCVCGDGEKIPYCIVFSSSTLQKLFCNHHHQQQHSTRKKTLINCCCRRRRRYYYLTTTKNNLFSSHILYLFHSRTRQQQTITIKSFNFLFLNVNFFFCLSIFNKRKQKISWIIIVYRPVTYGCFQIRYVFFLMIFLEKNTMTSLIFSKKKSGKIFDCHPKCPLFWFVFFCVWM